MNEINIFQFCGQQKHQYFPELIPNTLLSTKFFLTCKKKKKKQPLDNVILCRKETLHKKVLLRECKRHTTHHIASARSAALSPDGGYPHPVSMGVPYPVPMGVPPSGPDRGVPHPVPMGRGVPTVLTWVPPCQKGWGIPLSGRMRIPPFRKDGVPVRKDGGNTPPHWEGWGYPPPNMDRQTFPRINITFPREVRGR